MYTLGGFIGLLFAVFFVSKMDKLWFRISLAIITLIGIIVIAYYGGKADIYTDHDHVTLEDSETSE